MLRIAFGVGLISISVLLGVGAYWYFYLSPIPLGIAVAPVGSEISQFFVAFAEKSNADGNRVKIIIVPYANIAETTAALDAGDVDLAYVRADYRMPTSGQAVAILQQNIAVLVACSTKPQPRATAPSTSKLRSAVLVSGLKDLRGRRVAVLGQGPSNVALLEKLLALHGIMRGDSDIVRVGSGEQLSAIIRSDAPDALFLAGARGEVRMTGGLQAFKCAGDIPAAILPITEGAMLAARNKTFTMVDLAIGELAVNPPRPEEETSTVGFPSLLVARRSLSEGNVEEFMKQLFAIRQALMTDHPAATRIEPLPTDRGSAFALHPGATRYYDAEDESFFVRYEVLIYIALFGFSGIASGLLWFGRQIFPARDRLAMQEDRALERLINKIHTASTNAELNELERQLDSLLVELSGHMVRGKLDVELTPAYELLAERATGAIALRRRTLSGLRTALDE